MTGLMITVYYSCTICAVQDHAIKVPARMSTNIDVTEWMQQTMQLVVHDHHHRHPDCMARELRTLKVPIDGVEWIGGPAIS